MLQIREYTRHLSFYQFQIPAQAADIPSASGEDGRFELMRPVKAILNLPPTHHQCTPNRQFIFAIKTATPFKFNRFTGRQLWYSCFRSRSETLRKYQTQSLAFIEPEAS